MRRVILVSFLSKETEGRLKRHYEQLMKDGGIEVQLIQGVWSEADYSVDENVINIKLKYNDTVKNLLFFCKEVKKYIKGRNFDYIFLNNYYVSLLGLCINKKKLIYDAYELYYPGCGKRFSLRDYFFYFFESICVKKAKIVTAANSERALVMTGRYKLKEIPFAIRNISDGKEIDQNDFLDKKFAIVYAGYLSEERNIEKIVDAIIIYNQNRKENLELHFYGRGPLEQYLQMKCKEYQYIKFYGEYKNEQLNNILKPYMFGYVCYDNDEMNTILCSPNKLYDYVRNGVVILANSNFSISKFISENQVGVCHDDYIYALGELVKTYQQYKDNTINWRLKPVPNDYGDLIGKMKE